MISNKNNNIPVSVLLLIGGYENEKFDSDRISYLERSIKDIKNQTLKPKEILVSLNNNVSSNKDIEKLLNLNIPQAKIFRSNIRRSVSLNHEMLLQLSSQKYICFWSDHDIHHERFLEETYTVISKNNGSLVCPLITEFYNETILDVFLKPINTCKMTKVEAFKKCLEIDCRGSVYGMYDRQLFQKFNIMGNENFDDLLFINSSLENGFVFFESGIPLLKMRDNSRKREKLKISKDFHFHILPKQIISFSLYRLSFFYRTLVTLYQIIDDSSLSKKDKYLLINHLNNIKKVGTVLFGTPNYGLKVFIKELLKIKFFKINFNKIIFLIFFMLYSRSKKKSLLKKYRD